MEVFGSSGVRGVANEQLTPDLALRIAKAAGSVWNTDRVAVTRDTRRTGRMLADATASGLASVGCDVDRLGIVPTPGAQAHADREGVPVVVVTASHNPPEYNGIKLVGPDGIELTVPELERIERALLEEAFATASWDETGVERRVEDARRRYIETVVQAADQDAIAEADLTLALDPGHGAGTLTSPEILRELGCRVVSVNAQLDGHFPGRDPEPVKANLADLGGVVRASDADLGIAHDGDADRAIFFDETGEYIEGDATLAALAAAELDAGQTMVSAVNVSQRIVDVCDERRANLELTPIGSTHIITRIRELWDEGVSVPLAGEGNGGIFFPDYRLARDGAYTAVRFLELIADRPASEIVAPYDGYHNVRTNLDYETDAQRRAMLDAAATMAESADAALDRTDGYRMDYGDAWVLARPSGTEPLVRIYAEARDRTRAADLVDRLVDRMKAARVNE